MNLFPDNFVVFSATHQRAINLPGLSGSHLLQNQACV